jgi:hypothetical protein
MFSFEWQAVLGDRPLSAAELASLERAAALKRPLVRLRGQWSLVDADAVAGLLRLAGQRAEASGADLLRSALGLGQLDLPPELELAGVEASGPLGTLLAGDLHQRAEAMATPEAFKGELRPYQQRGLGWLVFLGQLGLGACLADDMGLGKTAQLIASLLADPLQAPTLVVAPVTLLGNWRRELERFAPTLNVGLHYGPAPQRRCGGRSRISAPVACCSPAMACSAAMPPPWRSCPGAGWCLTRPSSSKIPTPPWRGPPLAWAASAVLPSPARRWKTVSTNFGRC